MELNELLENLKQYEDSEEFSNYAAGLVTGDRVEKYLETEDGKKLIQPKLDSYFSKGLETWKTNNLDGLVQSKVKELYPDADPKDTELAALKAQIEQMQAQNNRAQLLNKAQSVANEKKLPFDVVSLLIGEDEKTTMQNIGNFETAYNAAIAAAVDEKLKGNSYVPPTSEDKQLDGVTAAFSKLNPGLKF